MDPATYEHLRNKTLLFFIEKLLDPAHGGVAATANNNNNNENVLFTNKRTLHDLSCQFGSKGFTKEMRQIAGGSQSGLKKFLLTYPSIFKIDGDMVSYNVNSSVLRASAADNDSEGENERGGGSTTTLDNEAVEYFRERLMQYGIGIWVPVKSLLGHRSQAPPHIRHVSGQHIREFTNFLSKYPETFILNDQDEVLLKEFENYYDSGLRSEVDASKSIDKKRIIQLIEFYAKCISERGPMLVEQLFCAGNLGFVDEEDTDGNTAGGFGDWFKVPGDLSTFFKMYPQCFQVHSNLVTFSDSYKVGLEYLKRQSGCPVLIPISSPPVLTPPAVATPPVFASTPQSKPMLNKNLNEDVKPKPKDAPQQPKTKEPLSPTKDQVPGSKSASSGPKSLLKHRVSKILLQTINQNTEHDYKHDSNVILSPTSTHQHQNQRKSGSSRSSMLVPHEAQFKSLCESGETEELRAYILAKTTIVTNQRKAAQIIDEIINANEPISLDFEGINLGNDGMITLAQVGTGRGSVFIFDVLTQPGLIEGGESSLLGRLLCSGEGGVVKVMHDCRNDSVNLYRQFGIRLKNVFDTQVAHIVVQMGSDAVAAASLESSNNNNNDVGEKGGKQNTSKNISLNNLCSVYGTVCNPFKDKVKSVYRHDQKYWSRRPLTPQMIAYASCDVMCLVPSIHDTLKSKISEGDGTKAQLFRDLCEEQILTHIEPDEIRSRRRLRKNEADLRALREKLDKAFGGDGGGGASTNSSLVLSNREMRLLKHLHLTESEKEKLKLSLKVAKKLEKMSNSLHQTTPSSPHHHDLSNQACSSDSTSNSELTSLEYADTSQQQIQDARIAQIDSLEAIINRLIEPGGREDDADEFEGEICEVRGEESRGIRSTATQTISTGDIVITKLFDD